MKYIPCYGHFLRGIHRRLIYSPHKEPVTHDFGVFYGVYLNNRLNKLLSCPWFEMPWRSYDVIVIRSSIHNPFTPAMGCLVWVFFMKISRNGNYFRITRLHVGIHRPPHRVVRVFFLWFVFIKLNKLFSKAAFNRIPVDFKCPHFHVTPL